MNRGAADDIIKKDTVTSMNIAVVSGASSGLGREFVRGMREVFPDIECVWLIARRRGRLDELAASADIPCRVIAADITSDGDAAMLRRALDGESPDIRLLINNAGCGSLGDFDKSDIAGQTRMVDLNVRALTVLTRLALDHMSPGARIINVSSIASFVPNARMAVYSASKYYVRAFSRALGMELRGRRISVTAVCPGPMDTEFLEKAGINGNSTAFRLLPRISPAKVARRSLVMARRRRPVYTPGLFYKFYRFVSAIVPDTLLMWLART